MLLSVALPCLTLTALALAAPVAEDRSPPLRQKVLLISFDGFRWDYDRDVDTPNLDAMARDGVKAQYVTPPYLTITSPTHFTLLTGGYLRPHLQPDMQPHNMQPDNMQPDNMQPSIQTKCT